MCNRIDESEDDPYTSKTKKPKKMLVDAENIAKDKQSEDGDDFDFSNLKKKKKHVIDEKIADLDAQLEEAGILDGKEMECGTQDELVKEADETEIVEGEMEEESWLQSERDYTYDEVTSPTLSNVSSCVGCSVFSTKTTLLSVSARKSPFLPPSSIATAPKEPSSPTSTTNPSTSTVH
jgi:hypothetical protein